MWSQVNKVICLSAIVFSMAAYGQDVRGTVTGTITDPSGAPVAGAVVTVTNAATNTSATTRTTESGNYVSPFLAPGSYVVTVEHPGFKKFVRQDLVLESLDVARVDVRLEIGATSDSVTVSSETSALQTETATRGQTISGELLENVPTMGRNPFQLAWDAPGIVKTGSFRYLRAFDIGGTSGFSINGGKNQENEVLLDGISDVQASRQVIGVPIIDSVQEFKVLTNTYDAQYGRTGGGTITIVTKGGGNGFHGNAFEYLQNDKLNANQSELNSAGTPKSPNHINMFGFHAGGPVYIPKVYNGKNKLFWSLAYEGERQRSADPGVASLPIDAWRKGDFSSLLNAQGQPVLIYDPTTTQSNGTRMPFSGNIIPSSRINPIASKVFSYYPEPNTNGSNAAHLNNYVYPSRWVGDMNAWVGRADYQINSKNSFFFRYSENPYTEYRSLVFVTDLSQKNPAEPTGNAPLIRNGRNWTFDWTSILNSRMTFDLRAGLNRWEETTGNVFGANYDPTQLGFASSLVSQFTRLQFPYFTLGTYQAAGSSRLLSFSPHDTYTVQPNMNMVVGNHFLKFGFEARRYNDNTINPGMASGVYNFDKNWTQAVVGKPDAVSGNEAASFLLGYPASASVDRNIDPAFIHYYYDTFVQDDWKITRRLTLNLGLRWDYEAPATERYNRMLIGLDLNAASPIASQAQGLNLKGAALFAGVGGNGTGAFQPDKNNFGPRIGAAYLLGDKWVLRGGYGLYYLGQAETGPNQGFSNTTNAIISTDGLRPAVNLQNAFALLPGEQLLPPVGSSQGAASFLGQSVTTNFFDRPLPFSQQYSFDIQREIKGVLIEVGYSGNQSRKLPVGTNLNYVPTSQLYQSQSYYSAQVANPMAGLIPNNAALNGATTARQNLLYAYPQYSQVTLNNLPIGKMRYDGFVSKATKRFSNGLTFIASYTFSKDLEQVDLLNMQDLNLPDVSSTKLEKRPANQVDIPQKFNFSGVYDLPFGRGRRFGNGMRRSADYVVGGWELNWNYSRYKGWALQYPNAAQVAPGSAALSNPTTAEYFNTQLWIDPATGKYVPAQANYTLRNFPTLFSNARLPGYNNLDASVAKFFPITEQIRLQFRFEMVNAMNHPWYSNIQSVDVTNSGFGRLNPTQQNLPRFLKLGLNLHW
jgi:Carboxypeptidase regulatory-like domain/TonB dependent receptor